MRLLIGSAFLLDPTWPVGWLGQGAPIRWFTFAYFDLLRAILGLPEWMGLLGVPVGIGVTVVCYRRVRYLYPRDLAGSSLLSMSFGPYVWFHDPSVMIPAALWLAGLAWSSRAGMGWLLLLIAANLWTISLMPAPPLVVYVIYMNLFVIYWMLLRRGGVLAFIRSTLLVASALFKSPSP